jgi:guanine deaminase
MSTDELWIRQALDLAANNVRSAAGGPFGAVIVRDGQLVARGVNTVTATNDPTAHAEVNAIREACRTLQAFQLQGCVIYSSCEPCPMCLGAIYWARLEHVFFANTQQDAAQAGFNDAFIYSDIALPMAQRSLPMTRIEVAGADQPFAAWRNSGLKIDY